MARGEHGQLEWFLLVLFKHESGDYRLPDKSWSRRKIAQNSKILRVSERAFQPTAVDELGGHIVVGKLLLVADILNRIQEFVFLV